MPDFDDWAIARQEPRPPIHVWVMDENDPQRVILNVSRDDFLLLARAIFVGDCEDLPEPMQLRLDEIFQDLDAAAFSINPSYLEGFT